MTLDQIALGQRATIKKFNVDPSHLAPLMEMGLFEGTEVVLRNRAPMGDPLELQVGDFNLSLRLEEARGIEVSTGEEA